MEKNPEKKPKKMRDNCDNCEEDYKLKPENTLVFTYPDDMECSHIVTNCPHCDSRTAIYGVSDAVLERAIDTGITVVQLEKPSDSVYQGWLDVMGIELIEPRALTDRQEAFVTNYGRFLQTIDVTVEDFMP